MRPFSSWHTFALASHSPVMAAEMSDEATLAPSFANGIDSDPTAGKQTCASGGGGGGGGVV